MSIILFICRVSVVTIVTEARATHHPSINQEVYYEIIVL